MKLLFPGNENTPCILNEIPPNHASQASFLTLCHVPSSSKSPLLPQISCYVLCHSETKLLTKTNHILFSFKTTCLLQEIPKWEHKPTVKTPSQVSISLVILECCISPTVSSSKIASIKTKGNLYYSCNFYLKKALEKATVIMLLSPP